MERAIRPALLGLFLIGCGGGGGSSPPEGTGVLQGVVRDATTLNPIPHATLAVQGTHLETTADSQGRYTLSEVPAGTQTVVATAAGYHSQSQSVNVAVDTTTPLDFSLAPLPAGGKVYYVAKNGRDTNPGTSDSPWLTIQHAAETAVAGDTVYIRAGTYQEHIHFRQSGTPGNYIVFSAYPGETPIIDGTGVTESQNGLIVDQSYLKLIGLEIQNWEDTGIWMEGASHIEISDCEVHDVVFGIGAANGTHDFLLQRVEMHHFTGFGFDASPGGGAPCYNGTINDCIAHTGRDPSQNVDGFALGHGDQHNFVFNRCRVYEVYDGFDISARDTTLNRCSAHDCWNGGFKLWQDRITLVNCLSYHNAASNVELDWDGQPGTSTLQNCTLVDAGNANVWVENPGDSLHMYNCLLAGGDNMGLSFEQMGVQNYRGDYNVFHNDNADRVVTVGYTDEFSQDQLAAGAWTTYSGQDAHSLVVPSGNDLFVDLTHFDFHLSANSPAIDQGTSAGAPSEDYEGHPRPQGHGYDIGAYERQ